MLVNLLICPSFLSHINEEVSLLLPPSLLPSLLFDSFACVGLAGRCGVMWTLKRSSSFPRWRWECFSCSKNPDWVFSIVWKKKNLFGNVNAGRRGGIQQQRGQRQPWPRNVQQFYRREHREHRRWRRQQRQRWRRWRRSQQQPGRFVNCLRATVEDKSLHPRADAQHDG